MVETHNTVGHSEVFQKLSSKSKQINFALETRSIYKIGCIFSQIFQVNIGLTFSKSFERKLFRDTSFMLNKAII